MNNRPPPNASKERPTARAASGNSEVSVIPGNVFTSKRVGRPRRSPPSNPPAPHGGIPTRETRPPPVPEPPAVLTAGEPRRKRCAATPPAHTSNENRKTRGCGTISTTGRMRSPTNPTVIQSPAHILPPALHRSTRQDGQSRPKLAGVRATVTPTADPWLAGLITNGKRKPQRGGETSLAFPNHTPPGRR
jgi:hypothetical protein